MVIQIHIMQRVRNVNYGVFYGRQIELSVQAIPDVQLNPAVFGANAEHTHPVAPLATNTGDESPLPAHTV